MNFALVVAEKNINTVMDVTYKKKLNSNIFNLLFLSLIITFLSACFNNNGEESDLPVYSIEKIIINPPDSFLINMPLKTYAISAAYIQFSENAVYQEIIITIPRIELFN